MPPPSFRIHVLGGGLTVTSAVDEILLLCKDNLVEYLTGYFNIR
jgi:hypothetical protein